MFAGARRAVSTNHQREERQHQCELCSRLLQLCALFESLVEAAAPRATQHVKQPGSRGTTLSGFEGSGICMVPNFGSTLLETEPRTFIQLSVSLLQRALLRVCYVFPFLHALQSGRLAVDSAPLRRLIALVFTRPHRADSLQTS